MAVFSVCSVFGFVNNGICCCKYKAYYSPSLVSLDMVNWVFCRQYLQNVEELLI